MTIPHLFGYAILTLALGAQIFAASDVTLELVSKPEQPSPASVGDSGELAFSADGKWAVFTSTGNGIVTNDNNGFNLDVFLRNNETGQTVLLSGDNKVPAGSGDGHSFSPQISPDGSFVIFQSEAGNLVTGDANEASDVFLFRRDSGSSLSGTLTLLSTNASGGGALTGGSGAPVVSRDGNAVLIETLAGLSAADTNESVDLYRITAEQIDLVSAQSNNLAPATTAFSSTVLGNFEASMSADGRFVAFISSGTNHYAGGVGPNAAPQIYLRDMQAQTNAWLTRSTNGAAAGVVASPVVSTNGEFVIFLSSAILPGLPTSTSDTSLYYYDIPTGARRRIATPGNGIVEEFELSENGQFIAYASTNQIWIHDLATGTNILASRTADDERGSGVSSAPSISADGRIVVFISSATNLVEGFTNDLFQTYSYDRETGEVALLSRAAAGKGGSEEDTLFPIVSADGSTAGFMSYSSNLVTNDNWLANDLFITSTTGTGAVVLATAPNPAAVSATPMGPSSVEAQALSLDGRYVVFSSHAADVVAGDANEAGDIFLRDLQTGMTKLISVKPDGTPHSEISTYLGASLDASVVAYISSETVTNLTRRFVFLHHRAAGTNSLESILPSGLPAQTVSQAFLSGNGRYLAFRESSSLTAPLYIRDLQDGTTVQHTPLPGGVGTEIIAFSPSGKYLLTKNSSTSYALHEIGSLRYITNIATTALVPQPFTADGLTLLIVSPGTSLNDGRLTLYSLDQSRSNIVIATNTMPLAISLDGSAVAYLQRSGFDTYLSFYDVRNGTNYTLSADGTNVPVRVRASAAFSANGRYFAFLSTNSFGTAADHTFNKLYVFDTVLKSVRLASQNALGEAAEFGAGNPSISGNGRLVVFDSGAANLVGTDLNFSSDVFTSRFAPIDSDADGLEDGWETLYFGGLTANGDADGDGDGVSNEDELFAGTDPNNATSNLALEVDAESETITITAPALPGVTYVLQARADFSTAEWETIGEPKVALSNSVTFEATLDPEAMEFFRIVAQ